MPIGPTTYFGKERRFVDRESCIQAFKENIKNSGNREYNLLFYYGIAGIGKSKLQKKLQEILEEEYPEILWAPIDLDIKTCRDIGTFLIILRNKIQEKHSAKFQLFNVVHAIYWKKLHPEIPLQKQNYPLIKKGEIEDKIIDVLENSGKLSLAWELLNSVSDSFRKWCHLHHLDISKIESLEPNKIEELLPGIFAADFFEYFGENSKFYIFIDTYEALWDGLRDKGSFHEKDEWIRNKLIPNMFGVSWVICGREKLLWVQECDRDWEMYLEQHSVNELPQNNCIEFLEYYYTDKEEDKKEDEDFLHGIEDKDIQDIIIKASEGVPFYLNLSVDTYEKIIIFKKRDPTPEDFGQTQPEIFQTFVKYLYSNEIRALEVLSAPNFWDQNLFEILMRKFDPGLPIGAFSDLIKFSFIKTDNDGKFSIHQLMRKSLQEHQTETERKSIHQFLLAYYSDNIENIDMQAITPEQEKALTEAFYHAKESLEAEDLFNWFITVSGPFYRAAFWQLITPIYEEMLQILEAELGPEHPDVATSLNNLAALYYDMGNYEKALPLSQRALDTREKVLGPEHQDVANSLNNLAALYDDMGNYEKSLPLYQRALEIIEKVLGPEHPDVAITLNNLALFYDNMGSYDKALPLYQRALDIYDKVLGPEHPDVATSLNNLALLYDNMGSYEKALPLYQRALDIREKVLGPEHPDVATTLNNLAGLYRSMGDYEKSLPLYQRVLEIIEKVLGPEHPDVASTLNSLAALYYNMGNYEKAFPLYQRALDIREKVLGPEHPNVAITLNNLAALYDDMGSYEKALPLYQRALEIIEKVLGPEHPDVAITLNNLAELYRSIGSYDKALPLYQRALDIYDKVLGPEHPDVATTLNNLALLYRYMGSYDKALPLYQRALDIREKVLGPEHPSVATTLNNLAELYRQMGDYEKSLPLYQRALDIREKVLGPEHPSVANSLNNLAALYRSTGSYEKALPLYQRALDIREKVLGSEHPDVATTLNNLAGLYRSMGDYEKSLPLCQRALKIYEEVLGPEHPNTAIIKDNLIQVIRDIRGEKEY